MSQWPRMRSRYLCLHLRALADQLIELTGDVKGVGNGEAYKEGNEHSSLSLSLSLDTHTHTHTYGLSPRLSLSLSLSLAFPLPLSLSSCCEH